MGLEIINKIKKEKGLTNAQIAKMSGVTLSTLDKITSGINKNPKLDTLQAICRVLGCRLDDFDDNPKENPEPFTKRELEHIKKYHELDEHGKEVVDVVTDVEHKRVKAINKDYLMPQAAHNDKGEDPEEQALTNEDLGEIK